MIKEFSWDYGHNLPPELWQLIPGCKAGGCRQSPVAIVSAATGTSPPAAPVLHYKAIRLEEFVFTASHLEIELPKKAKGGGGYIEDGGKKYDFQNFHIHTPSEHTLDGRYSRMEIHVVHSDGTDNIVLGVFVKAGNSNPELAKLVKMIQQHKVIFKPLELKKEVTSEKIDPESLFPKDRSFFYYEGSLTTPPCTENTNFFIFQHEIEASEAEIAEFEKFAPGGNNRPIQPLNERVIERCDA